VTPGAAPHATALLFGLSPLWVATTLFVVTYLVIMSDKLNRAIVALLGAGLLILAGVLNQEEAMGAVDWNTLGLLLGMMLIVNITRRSGLFQYVAIWSAKKVDARPWGILLMMSTVTAVFSAFLDNVTTVLLTVPVTLLITEELKVKPYPYLFSQIFASNIGGTATLIGDPPNIMIGSATGLTFNDFAIHLTPVIIVIFVATMIPIYYYWGRHLVATEEDRRHVMAFSESEAITDPRLLKQSLKEAMVQDYVLLARIKGFRELRLVLQEALRNAVGPTLALTGVQFTFLIGGTVIVERIFAYPGIGNLAIDAVINRDFPLIQGLVLLFGLIFILVNMGVDLAVAALNPRLRHA